MNEEVSMGDRQVMRVEEVQAFLGVGRSKVYEMIARGELPALRIGRLFRVPRSALEQWVEENTRRSGEAA